MEKNAKLIHEEVDLDLNDQRWTAGTSSELRVINRTNKWIFFKIKGTLDTIGLVSVEQNKGTIRPRATQKITFKIHVAPHMLKRGDTFLMFLIKWKSVDLDYEAGSFVGLKKIQRFNCVIRRDKAFVTPPKLTGDTRRQSDQM